MHRGIVEFDALSDTNGTRPDDDNALFRALFDKGRRLVVRLLVIGGIEIRRLRGEFCGAGIHHFIDGAAVIRNFLPGQFFKFLIGIPQQLALVV